MSLCRSYWFDELQSRNIKLHLIVGNHCTFFKNTNEVNSPQLLLKEYNNIVIYPDTTTISLGETAVALVPWICQDNYEQTMTRLEETKAQVVFGHLELAGFEMYKGAVVEHGMERDIFSKFDLVCSGHFHHRSTKGNVTYLGCPYEMTWSDFGDQKGFHIFDTDTLELEFIPNPYSMFNKIHYDDSDGMTIEDIRKMDFSNIKNSHVKVIIHNKTNPYMFDLFIDAVNSSEPISVQIVDDNRYLQLEDDDNIVNEAEDTLTILKKFVESSELSVEKTQIDKLINDLYFEASSL